MATVTGYTAAKMDEIVDSTVIGGHVDASGDLILELHDGGEVNGGSIYPSAPTLVAALLDYFHPIGDIKMTVVNTNPGTIIGGTWVAWGSGRVPVGVDTGQTEFDTVEETGGSKSVTLTAAQSGLVGHNHTQNAHTHTQNAHNHTENSHSHATTVVTGGSPNNPGSNIGGSQTGSVGGVYATNGGSGYTVLQMSSTTPTINNETATNQNSTASNNAISDADASSSHTNLQPYVTCYFWKRTA